MAVEHVSQYILLNVAWTIILETRSVFTHIEKEFYKNPTEHLHFLEKKNEKKMKKLYPLNSYKMLETSDR